MVSISKISIKNFRSIESSEINIDNVNALVGVNSSGKSAILKALNCFFNLEAEVENFTNGTHNYSSRKNTIIEIEFNDLSTSWTTQQITKVRLTYTGKNFRFKYFDEGIRKYKNLSHNNFNEIFQKIKFVFIPTHRDHTVANQGINGLLHDCVKLWIDQKNIKRDNWSSRISSAGNNFIDSALSGLEDKLTEIALLPSNERYKIGFSERIDYNILLPKLELRVLESQVDNSLSETGSGSQSMAVLSLYSFIAEASQKSYILGFEEPEQNLHPQAQQQLANSLKSMGLQVIFTTHSPVIIDTLQHTEITLCKKVPDRQRGFKTETHQIFRDFFHENNINRESYEKFHRRRNSDFFFSRYLILVESPNDAEVIDALLRLNGVDVHQAGGKIISADGKENFRFMHPLTTELEIPSLYIADKGFFLKQRKETIIQRNEMTGEETTKQVKKIDKNGFPVYLSELQNDSFVHSLFDSQEEKSTAIYVLTHAHTGALNLLENKKFISMKYALEHELLGSEKCLTEAFRVLNIQNPLQKNSKFLLEERSSVIKRADTLIKILNNIEPKNYPRTFSRIIKICKELESETAIS